MAEIVSQQIGKNVKRKWRGVEKKKARCLNRKMFHVHTFTNRFWFIVFQQSQQQVQAAAGKCGV